MKRSRDYVAQTRDLEKKILEDFKNSNLLLTLRTKMLQGVPEETLAAIHSFRRIFNHFLESGKLETINAVNRGKNGSKEVSYSY